MNAVLIRSNVFSRGTMLRQTGTALLILALSATFTSLASAQQPVRTPNLGGTLWTGSENAKTFSQLGFIFRADGTVQMIDARSKVEDPATYVRGTWSRFGDHVTIRFTDCVYHGRITGEVISGTAQFNNNGESWTFSVVRFKN